MIDHDPGDEHGDPPPASKHPLSTLLDEMIADGVVDAMPLEVFELTCYHEMMRSCCRACAVEACGEDGS